jgi:hypothetical protein
MSDWKKDGDAKLDGELARMRNVLGETCAPADGEERLRAAFRARHAALSTRTPVDVSSARRDSRPPVFARSRTLSRRRATLAAGALAASIAVAAVVLFGLDRIDGDAALTAAAPTRAAPVATADTGVREIPATAAFQPLLYSPGISPAQSYNVVRVRIPLTSLVGYDAPVDGTIEADLLVGEDGLPTGIRFDTVDVPLVSMTH